MSKVYQFRGVIAINLPSGQTHYMSESTAREIARAIYKHAKSIKNKEDCNQTIIKGNIATSDQVSKYGLNKALDL